MAARQYSSTATAKTLSNITSTTLTLNDISTLPTVYPYTLVISPDTAVEEIVTVRGLVGGTQLSITRGQDGTGSNTHGASAAVKHMITPRDMQEPQNHIEAASSYTIKNDGTDTGITGPTISKSVHGIASGEGSVVGTDKTQVLKNKTLSGTGAGANTFTSIPQSSITNLTTDLATQTSALASHEADTTAIHGIADTSKLPKIASASAGRTIFVQAATPTALATGDIWFQVTGL